MIKTPREVLQELVSQKGAAAYQDPAQLGNLLRDLCPDSQREINLLLTALQEGTPDRLMTAQAQTPVSLVVAQAIDHLCTARGLAADAAAWTVESWAVALDILQDPQSVDLPEESVHSQDAAKHTDSAPASSFAQRGPWIIGGLSVMGVVVLAVVLMTGGGDEAGLPPVVARTEEPATSAIGPMPTTATATSTPRPTDTMTPTPTPDITLDDGDVIDASIGPNSAFSRIFQGTKGQLVEIRADRDPVGNVYPTIRLFDPFGEEVEKARDSYERGYARLAHILKSSGQYTVEVDSAGGSGPVTIRFNVDPYTAIESGQVISGSIDLANQIDRYRFAGVAGQFVEIRVVRDPTGSVSPRVILDNPFGDELENDWDRGIYGYVVHSLVLRDTGEFIVRVLAEGWLERGPYTLELAIDPYIPISLDATVQGIISKPEQRDRYQFEGVAGDSVYIRVDPGATGNLRFRIQVHDPSGDQLGVTRTASRQGYSVEATWALKSTGKHIIVVYPQYSDDRGSYTLLIEGR